MKGFAPTFLDWIKVEMSAYGLVRQRRINPSDSIGVTDNEAGMA